MADGMSEANKVANKRTPLKGVFVFVRLNTSRMFANMFAIVRMFADAPGDMGRARPKIRPPLVFFPRSSAPGPTDSDIARDYLSRGIA